MILIASWNMSPGEVIVEDRRIFEDDEEEIIFVITSDLHLTKDEIGNMRNSDGYIPGYRIVEAP